MTNEVNSSQKLTRANMSRREIAAQLVEAQWPDLEPEIRDAFLAHCDQETISRKRIRAAMLQGFVRDYLKEREARARRAVASELVQHKRKDIEDAGVRIEHHAFILSASRAFSRGGLTCRLTAKSRVDFDELKIVASSSETAEPDLDKTATGLITMLKAEVDLGLDQAEDRLGGVVDLVLGPAHERWLGDEAERRAIYLALPAELSDTDAKKFALRQKSHFETDLAAKKSRFLQERIAQLSTASLNQNYLSDVYEESLAFGPTRLGVRLRVDREISADDINRLITVPEDEFPKLIESLLAETREHVRAKSVDHLAKLWARVAEIPYVELLDGSALEALASRFYRTMDKSLKKKRSRMALAAIKEKVREAKYQDDVWRLHAQRDQYADVARYYPLARALKRKLVLYVGPTNSGKTWRALNELAEGATGAYLAPLRLLALEGQEELEKRGKPCSFLTGEERDIRQDAGFISSTIEMLNLDRQVDAVVIDEVQLLSDDKRGWAWLAAVLGAPAEKVIMTGSPDCIPMVKWLSEYLGEELVINECHRYNELKVAAKPCRLKEVTPGTAIICFSRKSVLQIKQTIEENSSYKVAVIYGNLSPQVRREEARRFREGEAEILISTDAIAMGLNLPIKEVIFFTTEKFDGERTRYLHASEIRQIGGRAGRYGFADFGVVNAFDEEDLDRIREAIASPMAPLEPSFFVAPGPNHVRIIEEVLNSNSLERVLAFFERAMEFSERHFSKANIDELAFLASFVDDRLPHLDLAERLTLASAPVDTKSDAVLDCYVNELLEAFVYEHETSGSIDWDYAGKPKRRAHPLADFLSRVETYRTGVAPTPLRLRDAEDYLKCLTVYAWLAYRYPTVFTELDNCETARDVVNAYIERSLRKSPGRVCVVCKTKLAGGFPHKICDRCFQSRQKSRRAPLKAAQGRG